MVFARIINLDFRVGPPSTWCVATFAVLRPEEGGIILTGEEPGSDENSTFQVAYYDMDQMPDFILPYTQYYRAVHPAPRNPSSSRRQNRSRKDQEGLFKVGDRVNVRFGIDEVYRGRVKRVHVPFDQIWKSPWQCYRVEWYIVDGGLDLFC